MAAVESIAAAARRGGRYLARRGVPNPEHNARWLLAHALGADHLAALQMRGGEALAEAAARSYGKLLCRRGSRTPLQYLLGTWEFYGLALEVGPGALIPRPDTETLVEQVLAELPAGAASAVDVGTGTGAIALALATARPQLRILAVDVSEEALAIAGSNVARHEAGARVTLVRGRDLEPVDAWSVGVGVDVVVSNPPYVSEAEYAKLEPEVREHEPRAALVAGASGLEAYERLVPAAAAVLRPGGLLAFEVGYGQADKVSALLAASRSFAEARVTRDLAGIPRVVTARKR